MTVSPPASPAAPVSGSDGSAAEAGRPHIERVMHELKIRTLEVVSSERLTPHMQRITLTGEDLADFASPAFDDHVKITVADSAGEPVRREYTPRVFDREKRALVLDFALHDAGPATRWALETKAGDTLTVGGPRGSRIIRGSISSWLLVGDETALPAIGRMIEEAEDGTRIAVVAGVPGAADEQRFESKADVSVTWVHRPEAQSAEPAVLLDAVKALTLSPETFIWIAAEASVAQAVKRYVLEDLGIDPCWIKSAGYWVKDQAAEA